MSLDNDYHELREDERYWVNRVVALASLYVVVAGTSVFFLIRDGAAAGQLNPAYPDWVYALIPIPTFSITALAIQNAITATVRGRLLIAHERAKARQGERIVLSTGQAIPGSATFHAQLRWIHGKPGSILAFFQFFPFFFVLSICAMSGAAMQHTWTQIIYSVSYFAATIVLLVIGREGLIAEGALERLEALIADGASAAISEASPEPKPRQAPPAPAASMTHPSPGNSAR